MCLAALTAAVLAGCGSTAPDRPDTEQTLLVGATPTGATAVAYLAVERGYDEAEGVELTLRRRGDAAKLLRNRRVDAALLDPEQIAAAAVTCVLPVSDRLYLCVPDVSERATVTALVRTLQRGHEEAEVDPESTVEALLQRMPGRDRAQLLAELDAASAAFGRGLADGDVAADKLDRSFVARIGRD